MKKTILSLLTFSMILVGYSQSSKKIIIEKVSNDVAIKLSPLATGDEIISGPIASPPMVRGFGYTVIGTTVYDLQTNGTSQRRIINHADKTISAVWTMDNGATPYTNRGAGYNYYDGSAWGAAPTSKIETTRNGWPALASSANADNEFVISHSGSGGLTLNARSTKGTGVWKETVIPTTVPSGYDVLWPRAVVGGANDSTLHVIAIVRSSATTPVPYKGLTNALVYYRSKDMGATWDIQDSILPGLDSSVFTYVASDAYSIDASGNTIALAVYNSWGDVLVYKSLNNGDTWTSTIVSDFPINKYKIDDGSDINSDGLNDTIMSCDGSGSMLIDNNGDVHVFYGRVRVLDEDTTDGNTSYFPGTNGLYYWNESFGADSTQLIAGVLDLDTNNRLDVTKTGGALPSYQVGLSSMPTCGISANGVIYLAYSAITESHDDGVQHYRHIYVMNSQDGGTTWSDAKDFTPDFEFAIYEAVYPSMAKRVDSSVHIVYQRDFAPGHSIAGDLDPASINDIVYLRLDTTLNKPFSSIDENSLEYSVTLYPNPTSDIVNVRISSNEATDETLSVSVIDVTGRTILSSQERFNGVSGLYSMNAANLDNGVYFIRIESNSGMVTKTFVKK